MYDGRRKGGRVIRAGNVPASAYVDTPAAVRMLIRTQAANADKTSQAPARAGVGYGARQRPTRPPQDARRGWYRPNETRHETTPHKPRTRARWYQYTSRTTKARQTGGKRAKRAHQRTTPTRQRRTAHGWRRSWGMHGGRKASRTTLENFSVAAIAIPVRVPCIWVCWFCTKTSWTI